jgi:hypothetical protein
MASSSPRAKDVRVLRDLARQYAELAAKPVQGERRRLWAEHFSLRPTRTPVIITYGSWNAWCKELFADDRLECEDEFYRRYERQLRMLIFHDSIGDDYILEPWLTMRAVMSVPEGIFGDPWGVTPQYRRPDQAHGAWKRDPPLKQWADMAQLVPPRHAINEERTAQNLQRLQEAVGEALEVNVERGPVLDQFAADISTTLAALRGLEQIMIDMYESPQELKQLLAFLRDGILANQEEAERAGDYSLTTQHNQAMTYALELPAPRANCFGRRRQELWGFFAAQEYAQVSPRFHDEFLFQYQLPIMEKYGLVHYGCCENLTRKIDLLRQLKNLRSIAVAPTADLRACAEQIGNDHVISWRPNPTDMVCAGWNEERIRAIIRHGVEICRGHVMHIHLKDVETVEGDLGRLASWTQIVREETEKWK